MSTSEQRRLQAKLARQTRDLRAAERLVARRREQTQAARRAWLASLDGRGAEGAGTALRTASQEVRRAGYAAPPAPD